MLEENISLKKFNTFGIDVKSAYYYPVSEQKDLEKIPNLIQKYGVPYMVLGGGSNILFTQDYPGLIIHNKLKGIQKTEEKDNHVWVESMGGENWHEFVTYCIQKDWGGIENLSLIPGNVGAAPIQNIGAYGVEVKDVFDHLIAFELETGKRKKFNKEACEFGYRDSVFKRHEKGRYLIEKVVFKLTRDQHVFNTSYGAIEEEMKQIGYTTISLKGISEAVISIRRAKLPDPLKTGNAGSFFKNPVVEKEHYNRLKDQYTEIPSYSVDESHVKIPAGWLIEKAGWKGKDMGGYGVHSAQALVLINKVGVPGNKIFQLSEDILQDISKRFGILLEREVNIV